MRLDVNGFNSNMIKSLPSFYLTEDRKQDNVLRRYLGSVFIGGTDDILKSINHTEDFIDPFKCPSEDLPALFKSWGLNYEPTLEEGYQRKLLANLGEVYRRKGSYSCVRYLVRSITGRDCDVIYTMTEDGERRLDVTLISNSLRDIVSGEIQRASEAIQKIIPQFLPFYLVPNVSFSSPRGSLDFPVRNKGFRTAERVFSDFTFKGLDNSFLNPNFDLGAEFWECSEDHTLVTSTVKKDSNKCLQSTWKTDSYFYQDFDVHYKDSYSVKAYFMCPTEYYNDPPVVTMLITCYRADGTIIHSILNSEVELNIKNRWDFLKRNIYIDEPLCTKVRLSFHCSVPNQVIYFSCPQLLLKSRVEQLQCADILSVTPEYNGCTVEWSPVMGANEYLIYSVTPKGELTLLNHWNTSNRYIWGNAPLAEEGLKLLVASSNGHITSELDSSKSALYYSRNSVTGSSVQIGDDCLDYPLQSLTLYGKSTQDYATSGGTPLGKNLSDNRLNFSQNLTSYQISNGVMTVVGGTNVWSGAAITLSNTLIIGQTYTVSFNITGMTSGLIQISDAGQGWQPVWNSHIKQWDKPNDGRLSFTFTAKTNMAIISVNLTLGHDSVLTSAITVNLTNIQLEKGSTATEYEPYYSNPNPDCSVDITSLTDSGFDLTAQGNNEIAVMSYQSFNGIITEHPKSAIVRVGDSATFRVSGGSTYQWQQDVGSDWVDINTSIAKTPVFTIAGALFRNKYKYRCIVKDSEGNTEISNSAILYVVSEDSNIESRSIAPFTLTEPLHGLDHVNDELTYNSDTKVAKLIKHTALIKLTPQHIVSMVAHTAYGNHFYTNIYATTDISLKPMSNMFLGVPADDRNSSEYLNSFRCFLNTDGRVMLRNSVLDNDRFSSVDDMRNFVTNNEVFVLYPLANPKEIILSSDEGSAFESLLSIHSAGTQLENSIGLEMTVNYCSNKDFDLGGVALG